MSELLTRVDERTQATHEQLGELKIDMNKQLTDLRKEITECYVTKHEFLPVQKIAYGAAGVMLLAVLGALVAIVIH